ncbi:MAG TPA: hypothetical protein EYP39_02015 [Ghiorsea sp.]|nr:hypothetical protein [Ghiorsea sp.]HIP07340.1 hypothetical protein [Mariprofundaceae bacterium]
MTNNTTLEHVQADLEQLAQATSALEEQFMLGAKSIQTQHPPQFINMNIDFVEFEDIDISYFGI